MIRAALFLLLVIAGFVAAIWCYRAHGPQSTCAPFAQNSPWCPR